MEPLIIQPPAQSKWQQIKERLKQPDLYIPVIFLVLFLAIFASYVNRYHLAGRSGTSDKKLADFFRLKSEPTKQSSLDGLVYPESDANRHPIGIMIENHPDSRPQSGLSSASVVYEAIAEGGITRFLAIFGPKLPNKVGPVRSARPYYLDWCLEYDCFYTHVGGSNEALDLINKLAIHDLDQFRYGTKNYGRAFYREPRRGIAIEHTMFSDPTKLYEIAAKNQWPLEDSSPTGNYKNDSAKDERPANQQVKVEMSSKQYNLVWNYDPITNSYKRTMGGVSHRDALTDTQLAPKVMIVQEVAAQPSGNSSLKMQTVGTGKAIIFQDGQRVDGTWEKVNQSIRTIFKDANGREIRFNRGQRWITIVNSGIAIVVQ